MVIYVDSSVMARAYLEDEPGHDEAKGLVDGQEFLVTSTLTVIEVVSALVRADRAQRIGDLDQVIAAFDEDVGPDGPVTTIGADQAAVEDTALGIVRRYGIRTLDALHLAVAELSARQLTGDDEDVAFASRDDAQRAVAETLGFATI